MKTKPKKGGAKVFRFPKGIRQVNMPWLLHDYSPWQDQVKQEMKKCQERYGTSKRAEWGYRIENGSAEIYVYKRGN